MWHEEIIIEKLNLYSNMALDRRKFTKVSRKEELENILRNTKNGYDGSLG